MIRLLATSFLLAGLIGLGLILIQTAGRTSSQDTEHMIHMCRDQQGFPQIKPDGNVICWDRR